MSNRTRVRRTAARPYSTRQRQAVTRTPRTRSWWPLPPRRLRSALRVATGLAVAAELGHLAAALVEWPDTTARGGFHIAAGALLGLLAAMVWFGPNPGLLAAGAAVALAGPVLWLAGSVLAASPYAQLPVPVAIGVTAGEVALAALLLAAWRNPRPAPPTRPR